MKSMYNKVRGQRSRNSAIGRAYGHPPTEQDFANHLADCGSPCMSVSRRSVPRIHGSVSQYDYPMPDRGDLSRSCECCGVNCGPGLPCRCGPNFAQVGGGCDPCECCPPGPNQPPCRCSPTGAQVGGGCDPCACCPPGPNQPPCKCSPTGAQVGGGCGGACDCCNVNCGPGLPCKCPCGSGQAERPAQVGGGCSACKSLAPAQLGQEMGIRDGRDRGFYGERDFEYPRPTFNYYPFFQFSLGAKFQPKF